MKKLNYLLTLSVLLALAACGGPTFITPSNDVVLFEMEGGKTNVTVSSDGEWQVQSSPDWVNVTVADSVLSIEVGNNDTRAERTGDIILAGGDIQGKISIKQATKCTKLEALRDKMAFDKTGGTDTVTIVTDGGNINIEADEPFTATLSNDVLTVTAPANNGSARGGKITLSADELSAVITINQEGNVCQRCGGSGKVRCNKCGGRGEYNINLGDGYYDTYGCKQCGGSGWSGEGCDVCIVRRGSGKITCPTCHGSGR